MKAAKASLAHVARPRSIANATLREKAQSEANAADLIIVAGISGSGKSTFLEQIQSGYLPEGLMLPDGAKDWPVVGTKRPDWPADAPGLILHYDMSGRGLWNGADYRNDAPLALIDRAKAVIVINLCPPIHRVIQQLKDRETPKVKLKLDKLKRRQNRSIWRWVARALRAGDVILPRRVINAIRRRTPFRNLEEHTQSKLRVYEQPGWLEDLYARWGAYLDTVTQSGKPVRQVFVEPEAGSFRWRVVRAARTSGPRRIHTTSAPQRRTR
jgi:hypothetical protein